MKVIDSRVQIKNKLDWCGLIYIMEIDNTALTGKRNIRTRTLQRLETKKLEMQIAD